VNGNGGYRANGSTTEKRRNGGGSTGRPAKQADWHGQVDRGNEHRNANRVLVSGIDLSVQRRCATPAEPLPSASSPLLCFSVVIPFAPSPPFRRHRLSYGALMKVGTRSGRITSCVPITDIV